MPNLQKEWENVLMERLLWMRQLKKDSVHRKILHTKDGFVENDYFYSEEAIEATDTRKSVIKRLLNDHELKHKEERDKESDDDDDD